MIFPHALLAICTSLFNKSQVLATPRLLQRFFLRPWFSLNDDGTIASDEYFALGVLLSNLVLLGHFFCFKFGFIDNNSIFFLQALYSPVLCSKINDEENYQKGN